MKRNPDKQSWPSKLSKKEKQALLRKQAVMAMELMGLTLSKPELVEEKNEPTNSVCPL